MDSVGRWHEGDKACKIRQHEMMEQTGRAKWSTLLLFLTLLCFHFVFFSDIILLSPALILSLQHLVVDAMPDSILLHVFLQS